MVATIKTLFSYLSQHTAAILGFRVLLFTLLLLGLKVATMRLDYVAININMGDKIAHAIVFMGFVVIAELAYCHRNFWRWKGLPLLAYGAGIEVLQSFTPFRSFSTLDWVADLAGVLLGYAFVRFIQSAPD